MEIPKKEMLLTHVATNFSSLAGYRYGPELLYANIPWKIGYRKNENRNLGVYLFCCREKTDKIWSVATNISIRALSVNGKEFSLVTDYTFTNDSEFTFYGCSHNFDTVMKDYVVDDTLVFEFKVTIGEMSGIEKPEKKRSFEFSDEEPSDVVLKIAERNFHVTKAHIIAQSEYFKKLFMEKFKEGNQKEIELKEIDPAVFQVFLEVIYMEDALSDDNIEDVLKLVDMYDAKNVGRLCEHFLMIESKLPTRTKFQIAAKFKFGKLKNHCFESLKSRADVRAVTALDPSQLDVSICHVLIEKLIRL